MKVLLALVILIFAVQAGFAQEIMNREATEGPVVFTKNKKDKLLVGSGGPSSKKLRATKKQKLQATRPDKKPAPKTSNTGYIENKNNLHKRATKPNNKHKNRWG